MKHLLLTTIIGFWASCSVAWAQQPPPTSVSNQGDGAGAKPARCEHRSAVLHWIHQDTPADELIVVVARLGDGDVRPNLAWRRLHNVRAYWTEYSHEGREGPRRDPEKIVLAEGERVKGYGLLEFYVGGKLVQAIRAARNSDVDFGDCYPPDESYIRNHVYDPCSVERHRIFYPCRDRTVRRGRRR